WDLRPGHPETASLATPAWRAALSRAPTGAPWPDYDQHERLRDARAAIADHLRRRRGIAASADEVVLLPGVSASFLALPDALGLRGKQVAVEDPGYASAHSGLSRGGARVRPVSVDDDGLDPGRLQQADAAVYVTPAHQYPLGGRLPVARRAQLLDWALAGERWILEDDYDGDFRYDVTPLPPLRALPGAERCVVYLGTASKILTPGLRVAWAVLPTGLAARLSAALEDWGLHVSSVPALAVGNVLAGARIGPHIAAMSRLYAARRAALVSALNRHLPEHTVLGLEAGLHVVLALPDGTDDRALQTELAGAGLLCAALSSYAVRAPVRGLVLGYATLPESTADAAAALIAATRRSSVS
ncbi:MAG: PLP-dependent aminotransferase family protein, partial [Nocardioides sp.]